MDFNSTTGKASMKRKQSNSILQAFGKSSSRVSAIPIKPSSTSMTSPPTASSMSFSESVTSSESPYGTSEATSSRATSSSFHIPSSSGRRTSDAAASLSRDGKDKGKGSDNAGIRRPEDLFKVVKDRLFSWSFMVQWYQGDVHWLNTIKISRSTLETALGPSKVDQRARHFFVLGASLSALFDIAIAADFLRTLLKLLDQWEAFTENSGGKGVKNLFRGQKTAKRPGMGSITEMSGVSDGESLLLNVNLPFSPDFFQVHSSTCSIIRDIYKKILGMVLPARPGSMASPSPMSPPTATLSSRQDSLFHPSTFIQSAPADGSNTISGSGPISPSTQSISSQNFSFLDSSINSPSAVDHGDSFPISLNPNVSSSTQHDAFQALVAGELPSDRMLVGDGQKLTPQLVDLFLKVDSKLKKHFSTLLREGDMLARKVLDDELTALTLSLASEQPMSFDYSSALSATGNGYYGIGNVPQDGLHTATPQQTTRLQEFGSM